MARRNKKISNGVKKILFIVILSMVCATSAKASEIFGRISTDPNALPGQEITPAPEQLKESPVAPALMEETSNLSGGAVIIPPEQSRYSGLIGSDAKNVTEKPIVLGAKFYPDNSLLRGQDKKIYVIQGRVKKYVANLKELKNYRKQTIIDVADEELSPYQTRQHLDNELIRQKGDVKVYYIAAGGKHHIINLAELKAHWFGQEIYNISREEMELY